MKSLLLVALVLGASACGSTPREAKTPAPVGITYSPEGEPVGLHRYHRWSERVGQGAQPEGAEAFANLAALGFKTIVSVDGAIPAVELAKSHGLRYVHIPISYDGVPMEQALKIIKAVQTSPGPVYFHCHHGKHRGPAAMMVARITLEGVSGEEAVEGLRISGTSPEYEGLYRDVREFKAPDAATLAKLSGELPSAVVPEGVRAAMVHLDERWELLKACRDADWKTPAKQPDVSPAHEARMVWESYREMARTAEAESHGASFLEHCADAEKHATSLETALRAGDREAAEKAFKASIKSCNACHADFRN